MMRAASKLGLLRAWWGSLALTFALTLAPSAHALDVWTEPNPGLRHLHRSTPAPAEFHALVVDLTVPGVAIRCTPLRERWKSTSTYARDAHLAAAVNGGFWGLFGQGAQGLAAGGGQVWSSDDEELGFFAIERGGVAMVSRPTDVVEAGRRGITDAVSGRPLVVDSGRVAPDLYAFPRAYTREPRTAVGVSQDGHRVILVTVDGRRSTSQGGTLVELAELLIELGAYRGINLDGGGSTTMFVASEGGVVNRPSRGWEREVVNHIGVQAPAPPPPPAPAAGTTQAADAGGPTRVVQETPQEVVQRALANRAQGTFRDGEGTGAYGWLRARFGGLLVLDRLGLGRYREVVVPGLFFASVTVLFGTVWWLVRRLRRRPKPAAQAS